MGRRSSKAGRGVVGHDYETVGVTILPGHPMPEWADPVSGPAVVDDAALEGPDTEVTAPVAAQAMPTEAATDAAPAWGAPPSSQYQAPNPNLGEAPLADAPAFAMAAAPAYAMSTAPTPAMPPTAGTLTGAPPGPALAMAGLGHALPGPAAGGLAYAPGGIATDYPAPAGTSAAAYPSSMPTSAGAEHDSYAPAATPPPPAWPATAPPPPGMHATATLPPARTGDELQSGPVPPASPPPVTSRGGQAGSPDARTTDSTPQPSAGWSSADRPELSPEHVALLTWWADMIANGQYPAPATPASGAEATTADQGAKRGFRRRRTPAVPPTSDDRPSAGASTLATAVAATSGQAVTPDLPPAPHMPASESMPPLDPSPLPPPPPRKASRRGPLLVGLGLGAIALAGVAVAFGPGLYDSLTADEAPAAVAPTTLTMPTTVGDLVVLTSEGVDAQLAPLIGLGARPTGVTATSAYGTAADAPLALAAMATTLPAPGDAAQQFAAWATRTGATVGEPVVGYGTAAGITCADATGIDSAPDGAVCVWTGTGDRGQTFVVATSAKSALDSTANFRSVLAGAGS